MGHFGVSWNFGGWTSQFLAYPFFGGLPLQRFQWNTTGDTGRYQASSQFNSYHLSKKMDDAGILWASVFSWCIHLCVHFVTCRSCQESLWPISSPRAWNSWWNASGPCWRFKVQAFGNQKHQKPETISKIMWEKQCHKPAMTGNGKHSTYIYIWLGDGLWHCFTHIILKWLEIIQSFALRHEFTGTKSSRSGFGNVSLFLVSPCETPLTTLRLWPRISFATPQRVHTQSGWSGFSIQPYFEYDPGMFFSVSHPTMGLTKPYQTFWWCVVGDNYLIQRNISKCWRNWYVMIQHDTTWYNQQYDLGVSEDGLVYLVLVGSSSRWFPNASRLDRRLKIHNGHQDMWWFTRGFNIEGCSTFWHKNIWPISHLHVYMGYEWICSWNCQLYTPQLNMGKIIFETFKPNYNKLIWYNVYTINQSIYIYMGPAIHTNNSKYNCGVLGLHWPWVSICSWYVCVCLKLT